MRALVTGFLLSSALVAAVVALGGDEEVHQREPISKNSYFEDDVPHVRAPW